MVDMPLNKETNQTAKDLLWKLNTISKKFFKKTKLYILLDRYILYLIAVHWALLLLIVRALIYLIIYKWTGPLVLCVECLPMVHKAGVQSQVGSYQRLKKWFDAALLKTQHYKVRIKDKMEQSWEWSSALPNTFWKGSLQVTLD